MSSKIGRACVALAVLLGVQLSSVAAAFDGDSLRPNDEISGALKIGRREIVLPEGQWRVVSKAERAIFPGSTSGTLLAITLDEIQDKRLRRILEIVATKYMQGASWTDDPCKTKGDAFYMEARKHGINDQRCIRVSFKTGVVVGARGDVFQAWARKLAADGIGYSVEMPLVSVVRFTNYDYLSMQMSFDPDLSAIPPSAHAERALSSWNGNSPELKQKVFYEALKEWAPQFAESVDRAFKGDRHLRPADYGSPKLQQ